MTDGQAALERGDWEGVKEAFELSLQPKGEFRGALDCETQPRLGPRPSWYVR